jgi:diguanylate cyclase (GGDEF)-like protein/PAS domain S-box-containing protein
LIFGCAESLDFLRKPALLNAAQPLLTRNCGRQPSTSPNPMITPSRKNQIYVWLVIVAGLAVTAYSGAHVTRAQLDIRFFFIAITTILIGPRLSIRIPQVKAHISVSDTFVFLTILLSGGEVAILLATAEAACASVRIGKKTRTHLFNASVMASATFITVWTIRLLFGDALRIRDFYSPNYIVLLCTMAVVQYLGNSLMIAASSALKSEETVWQSWRQNYLWTSITYLAGACAAGIIVRFIGNIGFFAFSATLPIVAIVYFTYWTYMKNVEGAASQAEQARRHVEELNSHITEQERISKALRETEEHFRNAFDYAAIGMALVSPQGGWLRVNRSLCDLLGYTEHELLNSNFQAVTHADDLGSDLANLYRLMQGETPNCQVEKRYVHRHGQIVWALSSVSLVRDSDQKPGHFIFQIQDITERKRAEAALQSLSLVDELTGLYNRRGFLAVSEQSLVEICLNEKIPAIVYADLDGLKEINDSLGHHEGDRALARAAEILKESFRSSDIVARIGGDEFVVLAGLTHDESAESLSQRLQENFDASNKSKMRPYNLALSVGIAHFDDKQNHSIEELMAQADRAMYEDKRRKRSRGSFTPQLVRPRMEAVA